MAKSVKGKNVGGNAAPKVSKDAPNKPVSKPRKQLEDDEEDDLEDLEEEITPKKGVKAAAKKSKADEEDDDDDDAEDEVDDWDKPEEEDDWDPDFEEFDLPKSKGKKSTGGAKKGKEDDDLGVDDEFKDMDLFNDRGFDDEDDDF